MKNYSIFFLMVLSQSAFSEVYQCQQADGSKKFQQIPCSKNEEEKKLNIINSNNNDLYHYKPNTYKSEIVKDQELIDKVHNKCIEFIKNSLKDPESMKVREEKKIYVHREEITHNLSASFYINSKNGYGGYAGYSLFSCTLDENLKLIDIRDFHLAPAL